MLILRVFKKSEEKNILNMDCYYLQNDDIFSDNDPLYPNKVFNYAIEQLFTGIEFVKKN